MTSGMWYRATLSTKQVAGGHVDVIRRLFAEAISGSGISDGACLFATSHDTVSGRLRENARVPLRNAPDSVFFSPASISAVPHLIAQYRARPSPPPDREGAALLVGDERDWDLLPRSTH